MANDSSDPFEVFGLPVDADEQAIRQRYLQLVREFPPDRSPEQFTRIRAAYETLSDPVVSMKRRLFEVSGGGSLDRILGQSRLRLRDRKIPTDILLSIGR